MQQTALYPKHIALGAKIAEFAGWQMPMQYPHGVLHEHHAVRESIGIFDVSHMGRINILGKGAEELLEFLSANTLAGKPDGTVTYTTWCRNDGTTIDDLLVYRLDKKSFFVVANAGNRQKDLEHLKMWAEHYDVAITHHLEGHGIIAVQGPRARHLIENAFPQTRRLAPMACTQVDFEGYPLVIATTGYTGASGYEVFAPDPAILLLWDLFLIEGAAYGIEPIGLAARDTLRLEMGYALYGHEISDTIAPTESVARWSVRLGKGEFLGKDSLLALEKSPHKRSQHGILVEGNKIPRAQQDVFSQGKKIGTVTSGNFAPSLQKNIAIIMVDQLLKIGDTVEVAIREAHVPANVVSLPFLQQKTREHPWQQNTQNPTNGSTSTATSAP